jgi:hypothetical protein
MMDEILHSNECSASLKAGDVLNGLLIINFARKVCCVELSSYNNSYFMWSFKSEFMITLKMIYTDHKYVR